MSNVAIQVRSQTAPGGAADRRWTWLSGLLAIVLLGAASLKAFEFWTLTVDLPGFLGQRWVRLLAIEAEMVLAALLLSGRFPRAAWGAALLLWSAFVCVAAVAVVQGRATCGCLGLVPISPTIVLVFDLCVIAGLLAYRPTVGRISTFRPPAARVVARWAALGVAGFWAAWNVAVFARPHPAPHEPGILRSHDTIVLNPIEWVGRPFLLGQLVDTGTQLQQGQWLCLFYRSGCEHCEASLARYARFAAQGRGGVVLLHPQHRLRTGVIPGPARW